MSGVSSKDAAPVGGNPGVQCPPARIEKSATPGPEEDPMKLLRVRVGVAGSILPVAAAALLACPCAAQTVFTVTGPGGTIPSSGTGGGGTWPTALPPSPFHSISPDDVPVNACRFTKLTI